MKCLVEEAKVGTIPDFQFVEINCLRISQPVEAYTLLWRALSGEFSSAKVALKQLTEFFAKQDEHPFSHSKMKSESRSIACLLDELDFLITADEQVHVNPSHVLSPSFSLSPALEHLYSNPDDVCLLFL